MRRTSSPWRATINQEALFAFLKNASTPYSLGLWIRFKANDLLSLLDAEPRPLDYVDPHRFALDWACFSFVRKNKWMKLGFDRRAKSIAKALEADARCGETNRRFILRRFTLREEQLLSKVSRKIEQVIGPSPPADWGRHSCWGPGATSTLKGDDVSLDNKLREKRLSVTNRALPFLAKEIGTDLHWARARGIEAEASFCPLPCEFDVVTCNRVVPVPKTAKADRIIAAEPTGNIFLQKALGKVIRSRLKRFGINLDDQSRNQYLASIAYNKALATIDLESASDSLSIELVFDLLPIEWANLLDSLRVSSSRYPDGRVLRNEKFSSMGNGFTFELESLVFYAIAFVANGESDEFLSVFGDDIIVPQRSAPACIQLLELCGFRVNASKSFIEGNFYESCGRHYFKGLDVTPPYQKESLLFLSERIRCANRIYRWHYRIFSMGIIKGSPFSGVYCLLTEGIPYSRLSWPTHVTFNSDDALVRETGAPEPTLVPPYRRKRSLRGLIFRPTRKVLDDAAMLAYWLRFGSESPLYKGVALRSRGSWVESRIRSST